MNFNIIGTEQAEVRTIKIIDKQNQPKCERSQQILNWFSLLFFFSLFQSTLKTCYYKRFLNAIGFTLFIKSLFLALGSLANKRLGINCTALEALLSVFFFIVSRVFWFFFCFVFQFIEQENNYWYFCVTLWPTRRNGSKWMNALFITKITLYFVLIE